MKGKSITKEPISIPLDGNWQDLVLILTQNGYICEILQFKEDCNVLINIKENIEDEG